MNYPDPPSTLPRGSVIDLYLRFSSDGQSVESQEHALRQWASEHGLVLRQVFADLARSGGSVAGRDAFLRMCDEYLHHPTPARPAGVVLWSFARFAREVKDAEYYKWTIRHAGYVVWSLIDRIPEGEYAPVFEALQHVSDAKFLDRLREETRRGLQYRTALKFAPGGFPPIGYRPGEPVEIGVKERRHNGRVELEKRYGRKWEFDPDTQARVAQAWQLRLAGASYLQIHQATHLFPSQNNYSDFFERVTYAGALKCGDEIVWDAHDAYVTRAEWERVQAMRQPRAARATPDRAKQRRAQTTYLFSGILRCGSCGWAMTGNRVAGVPSYRCDWRHRQGHAQAKCAQPSIVAHALHAPLLDWLARDVFTFERMKEARERLNALLSGERGDLSERRAFLEGEKKRLKTALARLVDAVERGGFVAELQERLDARRMELGQVEVELAEIEAQLGAGQVRIEDSALRVIADDMRALLEEAAAEGGGSLRALVRGTIKKAELSGDTLRLFYSPLPFMRSLDRFAPEVPHFKVQAYPVGARAIQTLSLGMVGAPNGTPTVPTYFADAPVFPLELAELSIARPSSGRKAHTHVEQSVYLQALLDAIRHGHAGFAPGETNARAYAAHAGIPLARASARLRAARDKGWIVEATRPGKRAGGVVYRVAEAP